jgi:hypothetical protein
MTIDSIDIEATIKNVEQMLREDKDNIRRHGVGD